MVQHLISAATRPMVRRGSGAGVGAATQSGKSRLLISYWSSIDSSGCGGGGVSSSNVNNGQNDSSRRSYSSMASSSSSSSLKNFRFVSYHHNHHLHQQHHPQQQSNNTFKQKQKRFLSSSSKQDFYKTLGVNKGDDKGTIKKAYFKLAKKYHPDTNKVRVAIAS